MKINVDQVLRAFNGEPMTRSDIDDTPATLKEVLLQVCINAQVADGDEKYRVYQLLQRIDKGGEIEVTAEEIAKLKKLAGDRLSVGVMGAVWDALEAGPKAVREAS